LQDLGAHLEELNVTIVEVSHPDFKLSVTVKVGSLQSTDSTLGVLEDGVCVLEDRGVAARVETVSRVVAVTSHEDVSSFALFLAVWVDGVGKAGGMVRSGWGDGTVKVTGDSLALPVVIHEVCGELVSPDTIEVVLSLVVVNHQLSVSVAV